jgi:ribosomal protein S27AE
MDYKISDGKIYVTPTTICPKCKQLMVSQTDLIFLSDGQKNDRRLYEFDFAEELQALPFVCQNCGHRSDVSGTDVHHSDGEVVEYL